MASEMQQINQLIRKQIRQAATDLHQHGRSQVFVLVPPVLKTTTRESATYAYGFRAVAYRRTRRRAACAKNAFVHPVKLLSVFNALVMFPLFRCVITLQEWLDRFVLLVELRHVRDEILDDIHCSDISMRTGSCDVYVLSGTHCEVEGRAWMPSSRFDRYAIDTPRC